MQDGGNREAGRGARGRAGAGAPGRRPAPGGPRARAGSRSRAAVEALLPAAPALRRDRWRRPPARSARPTSLYARL